MADGHRTCAGSGRPGINSQEEDRRRSPAAEGTHSLSGKTLAIIGGFRCHGGEHSDR